MYVLKQRATELLTMGYLVRKRREMIKNGRRNLFAPFKKTPVSGLASGQVVVDKLATVKIVIIIVFSTNDRSV